MSEQQPEETFRPVRPGAKQRRADSLRELHDQYAMVLWRYVVSLTNRPTDADDIVQETLLRAWRKPDLLEDDVGSMRGWLFTVARNLFIDRARSARRHQEVPSAQMDEEMDLCADRVEQLFDQMLLTDALDSLADHHRDVVIRAFYGGLSTAQLATELGIPEGTVKSRLHYGLRTLRLALQERGGHDEQPGTRTIRTVGRGLCARCTDPCRSP